MPTYEYECGKCGVFELTQRMSDKALSKCPTCKRKVQRLISASSFAFKGSGWYVTDYARKSGDGKPGATENSAKGDSSTSGSSDSKSTDAKSTDAKSTDTKPTTEAAKPAASTTEKSSS